MAPFPVDLIQSDVAVMSGEEGAVSIEIQLRQFTIGDQVVSTSIWLEGVALPSFAACDLEEQRFSFPVNPADGYIDGSIYIGHAHHPVDVTEIVFGSLRGNLLPATFRARIMFSLEGLDDFDDADCEIATCVRFPAG